jgi:hypothetical protein
MPSIPVDVLREILEHVHKTDRDIWGEDKVIQTIAQSTDLARRARSFEYSEDYPELATALRNMSSLRRLSFWGFGGDASILDGCSFKLDSFTSTFPYSDSLQRFLNGQQSLTNLTLIVKDGPPSPLDERFIPNLTQVEAEPPWLRILIPGRPVTDVRVVTFEPEEAIDMSFFTLSTAPIHSLGIPYDSIYPTPGSHLVSIFPSLANLVLGTCKLDWSVRQQLTVIGVLMKKSTIIDLRL